MRRLRWGMVERVALVLLCAVLLEMAGIVGVHLWQERELVSAEQTRGAARRLAAAVAIAEAAPADERVMLLHALEMEDASFNWVPRTVITDYSTNLPSLAEMRERLMRHAPELAGRDLRLNLLPSTGARQRDLLGVVGLQDGSMISFRLRGYMGAPPRLATLVLMHLLVIVVVFGAALLMLRALIRPLGDLAAAADAAGRDHMARVTPTGPHEVRRVASAFAAMQARLMRAMEDNTQALIAVSHDLRTPIQRMRLRSSMLEEEEAREEIAADLAEMEGFIDATLAYVRSGSDEADGLVDLPTLLSTMADDACDLGAEARYTGPDSLTVATRPHALRRMLDNVVGNARKYARRIEISLAEQGDGTILIAVDDDGPGIPPEDRGKAMQPYQRLHREADADHRGAGLGLALVQRVAQGLGGSVELETSALGGLSLRITLPRRAGTEDSRR